MILQVLLAAFISILTDNGTTALSCATEGAVSRRFAMNTVSLAVTTSCCKGVSWAENETLSPFVFEKRDRQNNKDAVIRDDYWYTTGRTPPRKLEVSLVLDDPQWNSFGSCETSGANGGATNSCTYVSLKQRIPAYTKYGFAISDGAREYKKLGLLLEQVVATNNDDGGIWQEAAPFLVYEERTIPPAIIDAELKMILFATAMLTSPNFPTPGRELLVARFYVNELHFANQEIAMAIHTRDSQRAIEAWKFGRDSWNSYFKVVNKAITAKVGEPLVKII
jgi:hypothetical protein